MNNDNLPFRLCESTFRRYEPLIAQAIRSSPEPVDFNPAPLRPTTAAARLRDSIISFRRFNWPNTSFSIEELDAANLMVRHNDNNVIIGTKIGRGHLGGESRAFLSPNHKRLDGLPVDVEVDSEDIEAFCRLLSRRLLSGPVILRKQALGEQAISILESRYDIAITVNDQDHTLLI